MKTINKSEIVQDNLSEVLGRLSENKPKIKEVIGMDEKYGIENIKIFMDSLTDIAVSGVKNFADGLQITDISFLPGAISDVVKIKNAIPEAVKEIKDLSLAEFKAAFDFILVDIYESLTEIKNELNSND